MFLCCSVCVAVCCSVLQRVAACCSVLQRVAACSIITTDQGCCYHDQKKCQVEHLSQKSSFTCQSQKLTTISSTCICQNNNSHFNQTKKTFGYQCQECECPDVSVGNNFHWNFKKNPFVKRKTLIRQHRTIFNYPSQKCQWLQKASANNFQMTIGRFETPPWHTMQPILCADTHCTPERNQ